MKKPNFITTKIEDEFREKYKDAFEVKIKKKQFNYPNRFPRKKQTNINNNKLKESKYILILFNFIFRHNKSNSNIKKLDFIFETKPK